MHVSWLKPFNSDSFGRQQAPPAPQVTSTGQLEFIVEKILDHCWNIRRRQQEFLVKWLGYPDCDSSWEPHPNFINSGTTNLVLQEYEAKHPGTRLPPKKKNDVPAATISS